MSQKTYFVKVVPSAQKPSPDPVCHFRAPCRPFWTLQLVQHHSQRASALIAAGLVFSLFSKPLNLLQQSFTERELSLTEKGFFLQAFAFVEDSHVQNAKIITHPNIQIVKWNFEYYVEGQCTALATSGRSE